MGSRRFLHDRIEIRELRCTEGRPLVRERPPSPRTADLSPEPEPEDRFGLGMALGGASLLYGVEVNLELFGVLGAEAGTLPGPGVSTFYAGMRLAPWNFGSVRPYAGAFGGVIVGVHADEPETDTVPGAGARAGVAFELDDHWQARAEIDGLYLFSNDSGSDLLDEGWTPSVAP
ncbi:MAG: hypothetical protein ACOC1F_09885 [Myxococcota bacterium]